MVVGVQVLILALVMTQKFQSPVGDDLVGIHIGGGTGTALEHIHCEVVMKVSCQNFITGFADGISLCFIQNAQFMIGQGSGFFYIGQSLDKCSKLLTVTPEMAKFSIARWV